MPIHLAAPSHQYLTSTQGNNTVPVQNNILLQGFSHSSHHADVHANLQRPAGPCLPVWFSRPQTRHEIPPIAPQWRPARPLAASPRPAPTLLWSCAIQCSLITTSTRLAQHCSPRWSRLRATACSCCLTMLLVCGPAGLQCGKGCKLGSQFEP